MRGFTRREAHDLGLKYVMDLMETSSPFGKAHKRTILPFEENQEQELLKELSRTKELSLRLTEREEEYATLKESLLELKDIRRTIVCMMEGHVLSELDLFEIKFLLRKIQEIAERGKVFLLPEESPVPMEEALSLLDPDGTGLSTFHVYDSYDPKLKEIRIRKKAIEKFIRSDEGEENLSRLLFERRKVVLEEEEEEYAVRRRLTEALLPHGDGILSNMDPLGRLDFLLAKAKLAAQYDTVVPEVGRHCIISMVNGYHPYFEYLLGKRGKDFKRVSMEIGHGSTVITGANMGGKSITLKTVFLNVVLVQMGILPFAEKMTTPILRTMNLLAEDLENPDKGLSSFGGEVVRLREIMEELQECPSLIVLDEPFRGTNPLEGKAMAGGLVSHFRHSRHFLLMATHYDLGGMEDIHRYQVRGLKDVDLKAYMDTSPENQITQVGLLSELMDYTLEKWDGGENVGDAVRIGEFLGLDRELTMEIRKLLK